MSELTLPDSSHEKSLASKWMDKFYAPLSKMLHEEKIIGLEIGDDYYRFKDPESLEGKEITIQITVK